MLRKSVAVLAFAAALYVARQVWNGTEEGTTSVPVMAGLGAIAGAWYAMRS